MGSDDSAPKMRGSVTLLAAILCSSILRAQTVDRTSPALPVVSDAYATLKSVSGWSKNHLGQWVELPGAIPYRSKDAIELSQFTDKNLGADNFTKLELRQVSVAGTTYPMLLVYRKVGRYRYPSISQDWIEYVSCRGFVFKSWPNVIGDSNEENKAYKLKFSLLSYIGIEFVGNEGEIKSKIQSEFQTAINAGDTFDENGQNKKTESKGEFSLLVFPVTSEGKRSVRFLFDYSIVQTWVPKYIQSNALTRAGRTGAIFREEIGSELTEFDKWYFEMPREAFIAFWATKMPGDK